MPRTALLCLALAFACAPVDAPSAQSNHEDAARRALVAPPVEPPFVWIEPGAAERPIELAALVVTVEVHGFVASTEIAMTLRNPNARVLQGELVFPLATGQRVTGYALDVAGEMREGSIVPKQSARVAFEEISRRRVDPGLAELTAGNVFRTRVYPLPAGGERRVVVRFDQPLVEAGDRYRYVLPMRQATRVPTYSVEVRSAAAPTARGLAFERVADAWRATATGVHRELVFELPKPRESQSVASVADRLEPAWRTFAARLDVRDLVGKADTARTGVRRVTLFYDASGSARDRDRSRELAFVEAWLDRHAGKQGIALVLVPFRDALDAPMSYAWPTDRAALRTAIAALAIDGGSSYGALRDAHDADVALVVGDGLSNFAAHEGADFGDARVVLVHAAQRHDSARLARLGGANGVVVSLLDATNEEALALADAPRTRVAALRASRGECTDLVVDPSTLDRDTLAIYGRCRGDATVAVSVARGGAQATRELAIDADALRPTGEGAWIERLWAVARIANLAEDDPRATALALQHGVVTKHTSLLVLETLADYVTYRVEPVDASLREQWRSALGAADKQVAVDRSTRIAQLAARWNEFVGWHEQRHPWLETVLVPEAERELAWWRDGDAASRRRAQAALDSAKALASRWPRAGVDDAQRAAWERDATRVMLVLDALKRERKADPLAPSAPQRAGGTIAYDLAREARQSAPADATRAGAPPPAPALTDMPVSSPEAVETVQPASAPDESSLAEREEKSAEADAASLDATIELTAWTPDAPYLDRIQDAIDPYAAYLLEREAYGKAPGFFLDCADHFRDTVKNPALARRILSNLAELDVESAPLLRVLAYRLKQWDEHALAVPLFEQVLALRGEEPQSRRDLALAHSGPHAHARAAGLLWEVATGTWDSRFRDIDLIALHELVDLLGRIDPVRRLAIQAALAAEGATPALLKAPPIGLRVALGWDANDTDVDLWIVDPTGERTMYSASRSKTGGHLTSDATGGYGPEVYTIRRPLPGTYVVYAHYYGESTQTISGQVSVQLEFQTNFGGADSRRVATTRRLEDRKQQIEVGRFTVK